MKNLIFIAIGILMLSSCVSSKKYKQLEASVKDLKSSSLSESKKNQEEKELLLQKTQQQTATLLKLDNEISEINARNAALQKENKDLYEKYDRLLDQNRSGLNSASSEKEELYDQLIRQKKDLEQKEQTLSETEKALKIKSAALKEASAQLDEKIRKIDDLQKIIDAQNKKSMELKGKLSSALKGFSDADLSVRESNGKVYVSLSQNLLFASGSDKIDAKGQNAVKQLAEILALNQDIETQVEGHTDNTGTADLNWDLSTNRALAIVKILTANKIEGKRITAAGRGMFVPLQANDTPANRAVNRRTEIILSPKLDELYKLLN